MARGRKSQTLPCDRDCFHCKFPDCIVDGVLDKDEYNLSDKLDEFAKAKKPASKNLPVGEEKKKARKRTEYNKKYYQNHKEKVAEYMRKWRIENKDWVNERQRLYAARVRKEKAREQNEKVS